MRQSTDKYLRQRTLISPLDLEFPVMVVGCGGTGSMAAFALAKMGVKDIIVCDMDKVEVHNIPSQLFVEHQVGRFKTLALYEMVEVLTGTKILPLTTKFQDIKDHLAPKVFINAVDSLEERREIWKIIKTKYMDTLDLYIDPRLGSETMRVLTVDLNNPESVTKYEKILASKTKAYPIPCTSRAVSYNTIVLGGIITSQVKKYAREEAMKFDFHFDLSNFATN